jgi:hypothetical protein
LYIIRASWLTHLNRNPWTIFLLYSLHFRYRCCTWDTAIGRLIVRTCWRLRPLLISAFAILLYLLLNVRLNVTLSDLRNSTDKVSTILMIFPLWTFRRFLCLRYFISAGTFFQPRHAILCIYVYCQPLLWGTIILSDRCYSSHPFFAVFVIHFIN